MVCSQYVQALLLVVVKLILFFAEHLSIMATFHRVLASPKRVQGTVGIVNFINQPEHFLSVNRHVRSLYILPKKQLSTTSSCLKTWSKK